MSRRNDRKHALGLVFQIEFHQAIDPEQCYSLYFNEMLSAHDDNPPSSDTIEWDEPSDAKKIDAEFVKSEFEGVCENKEHIDSLIETYSEGWNVSRLSKVDLAIIRLAVYEMLFGADIPKSVSINEAVELAKMFSSDEAPAFVNGVLGKIAANI